MDTIAFAAGSARGRVEAFFVQGLELAVRQVALAGRAPFAAASPKLFELFVEPRFLEFPHLNPAVQLLSAPLELDALEEGFGYVTIQSNSLITKVKGPPKSLILTFVTVKFDRK